ncbi:MAG: LLM class flavin-dependent oxidoreductase, partial [Chloroflexi bacterium]|nr:LLM class flavin-dependent oxidoreductase [Chloroflexota bacterium]
AHTTEMRVGNAVVILPIQHPVMVAERFATIDLLSNGRLEMGVGRGAYNGWFKVFTPGSALTTDQTRPKFLEAVEVIHKCWTQEWFTHDGEYFKVPEPINVVPKPLQKPFPRFHAPATSYDSLDIYPKLGINTQVQTWFTPLSFVEEQVKRFRKGWAEAVKNPKSYATTPEGEFSCLINMYCAPTRKQAYDEVRPYWEWFMKTCRDFYFHDLSRAYGGRVPPEMAKSLYPGFPNADWDGFLRERMFCVGSPEDCYDYIATLDKFGVDTTFMQIQVGPLPFDKTMKSLKLFGKEVAAHFLKDKKKSKTTAKASAKR